MLPKPDLKLTNDKFIQEVYQTKKAESQWVQPLFFQVL